MLKKIVLAAALTAMFASPALAGSCPKHMKAIDAALKTASLSAGQMSMVADLRAQGAALHKSGSHKESVAALLKAKAIMGIK